MPYWPVTGGADSGQTGGMGTASDAHWAAVSRATQLEAHWRAEWRRGRREDRRRRLRLRLAVLLVRAGLRVAQPLTVERLAVLLVRAGLRVAQPLTVERLAGTG